jgi:DNA mismatch repair protein MutS
MSLTPMMQQYLDIKEQHQDKLVMFRLGDFYELFFDDAVTASRELEITLTGREAGERGRVPMCGVPFHAIDQYLGRLIDKGYKVAICEQMEDPKLVKGLVRREVVRIVTPGTALRDSQDTNCFLASLTEDRQMFGISLVDVGTGEIYVAQTGSLEVIREQLVGANPLEIVVTEELNDSPHGVWVKNLCRSESISFTVQDGKDRDRYEQIVERQYGVDDLLPLELNDKPVAAFALGMSLSYIQETQKFVLPHLQTPRDLLQKSVLHLDLTAKRNLEITETTRNRDKKGSLLGLLGRTKTAIGSRTLRRYLDFPLQSILRINERLDAVESLLTDMFSREGLAEALRMVQDLERLIGKLSYGSANARDVQAIGKSLGALPEIRISLRDVSAALICQLTETIPDLATLVQEIEKTIVDDPPVSIRDGNMIRDGADEDLDKLRQINTDGKTWLASLERRERERTGIRNLKIGYNKVFGYYLEVSKSNVDLVPPEYERKQTLSTGERYILPELKEREDAILHATERALAREHQLFSQLVQHVLSYRDQIQLAARIIGELDALYALAVVSDMYHYERPAIVDEPVITIKNGRHPMVEAQRQNRFVPNSITLSPEEHLILLTGPNMGGKSTYMRQTALIVLLAHIGCFVPAEAATIGIVDRIFTRIGASDDLSAGQSTFMVEMTELAQILRHATNRSFVILDEIGRGTSTYDGLSIAEAVVEALESPSRRPLTIFATHYHELTVMAETLPGVKNYSVAVEEENGDVIFLHTVIPEPADRSYGIQVARLAGLPEDVVKRAATLLKEREESNQNLSDVSIRQSAATLEIAEDHEPADVLPLFHAPYESLVEEIKQIDVLRMTPLDAMTVLYQLVVKAKEL